MEAEVAKAAARHAEQAACQNAAQEIHRRHADEQQLAVLLQTLQQVWLVLLPASCPCFASQITHMLSDRNYIKQQSANPHMLLHVHALKALMRGPSSCK